MNEFLKQDICNLKAPGTLLDNITSSRVNQSLPPGVQYACLYWVQHLQESRSKICDNDDIHQFLNKNLLYWLEALALMRKISEGILALNSLLSISLSSDCSWLCGFIQDVKRFVQYSRQVIEQAPLQIYLSALIFAPARSSTRIQFGDCALQWMKWLPTVRDDWSALLGTLEGHTGWVNAVAFSQNGKMLASASNDQTVRLWDPSTGQHLHTLEGHTLLVSTVAFSRDVKMLASASHDQTVRLWDPSTGQHLHTLEGHTGWVNAVAFSQDGTMLASASDDQTVRLWNSSTGQHLHTLEGHTESVYVVAFFQNGEKLISASYDQTVRLWDLSTGQHLYTLEGHTPRVKSVAFSQDETMLAFASRDQNVRLWDIDCRYQTSLSSPNDSECFSTNQEPLVLHPGHEDAFLHLEQFRLRLAIEGVCITKNEQKLLWLPSEYRNFTETAAHDNKLALGYPTGQVLLLSFI
ncbi:WD40-repeat-containing domain protein [Aspergillus similis]